MVDVYYYQWKCVECKKYFDKKRGLIMFCSDACRQDYFKKKSTTPISEKEQRRQIQKFLDENGY